MNRCEYKTKLQMFENLEYINGGTKAVDIDFSFMYPSTSYFVNVNILFEFSIQG